MANYFCKRTLVLVLQTLLIAAFLSILPIHARSSNGGEDIALQQSKLARLPQFCFVVRTYWGHGDAYGGGLWRLLRSLQRQEYDRWEAVLLVADARPFVDIHRIVDRLNDDRVWVFAEWIGQEFMPKQDNQWVAGYHERLYNLTDDAIRVCPPNTDWVVVTNGDNEYGTDFIHRVVDESANENRPDIVSFDFYSRFQRITMPACERFAAVGGSESKRMPYCKKNTRSWCQSDLGAAALNWERLIREERCFGDLKSEARGLDAEHADGLMMEALVADGWKVRHISDSCLFVHSPSIQSCAWSGGVWDDRDLILNPGGRCITGEEANEILARAATNGDNDVEEVMVSVSNDGNVESLYMNASQLHLEKVRCLRTGNAYSKDVWGLAMLWYSEHCVDDFDMGRYKTQLHEFFPTIEAVQQGWALAERKALHAAAWDV